MMTVSPTPAVPIDPRLAAYLSGATLLLCCGAGVAAGPTADAPGRAAVAAPTQPLYRYLDPQGRTVYGNRPPAAGVQSRMLPYAPSPPKRPAPPVAPRTVQPDSRAAARPQTPANNGPSQQQVLLEQLARQIEALQMARSALKEGEAVRNGDERNYQRYLDRTQGLRDTVTRQEGVVEALQAQLRLLGGGGLVE